jgi:hypothetical protein
MRGGGRFGTDYKRRLAAKRTEKKQFSSAPPKEDNPSVFNRVVDYAKTAAKISEESFYPQFGSPTGPNFLAPLGSPTFRRTGLGQSLARTEIGSRLMASQARMGEAAGGYEGPITSVGRAFTEPSAGTIALGALTASEFLPQGRASRLGRTLLSSDTGEQYAREVMQSLDEPAETVIRRSNIQEAKNLVDSPQRITGEPRARTRGSVPVTIENIDEANELLFGANVRNTGSVGSTLTDDIYEGSEVIVGRTLSPERVAKDMLNVARKGVRERLGRRKASGSARPLWAKQTLSNFENDFGTGAARVTSVEGRRSITGPYDDASTIPQTIQHDHTIVSPSDLKAFRDETDELFKAKQITRQEKAQRKQVEKDMLAILQDPHNLIPVHRNTNILLSSFNRERLLNDPDFASSVQINEDTLGDIWGIMSRDGSGYRRSVEEAYAWARRGRKGKRAESVDAWQQWQDSRVDKTLTRRNQRLVQSGINLPE